MTNEDIDLQSNGVPSNYLTRPTCNRINLSEKFSKFELEYKKQFSHIYFTRSKLMSEKLASAAKMKWSEDVPIKKLSELEINKKCCVIGTIFKSMELQPSILKEISEENDIPLKAVPTSYVSENDKLILEDYQQRIYLIGNINPGEFYTGSVVACLGSENEDGQFVVESTTYAGVPPQVHEIPEINSDKYVLLVSGLSVGGQQEKCMQIQMLIDYILGIVGDSEDLEMCSSIIHVIIAGNSLAKESLDRASQAKAKYLTYKSEASTIKAMTDLDQYISQLVPNISVDLMCGEYDLSNHLLPQKPLHPCMLPSARNFYGSTFHTVSNPYSCEINGVRFLGTSGQNIKNMKMYSQVTDVIQLMSDTLELQHLAPTAPDTLGSFPFYDKDPFIIDDSPHVYFCGNQEQFQCKLSKTPNGSDVLLLSVPEFNQTSSAVLVNLKNLDCEEINISIDCNEDVSLSEEMSDN